ncbi:MAG: hypothetical protein OXF02_00640 [Simkaniaceae bacterium]|nr:hypothetical protein [Simkaniaceae bacterium]
MVSTGSDPTPDYTAGIKKDYAQWRADEAHAKAIRDQYAFLVNEMKEMIEAMHKHIKYHGRYVHPDEILNLFMYKMMGMIMGKFEEIMTIASDELNILSGYRSLVGKIESGLNSLAGAKDKEMGDLAKHPDDPKPAPGNHDPTREGADYDDTYKEIINEIKQMEQCLKDNEGTDENGNQKGVLDTGTVSQTQESLEALYDPGGTNDPTWQGGASGALVPPEHTPAPNGSRTDFYNNHPVQYLIDLWASANFPSYDAMRAAYAKTLGYNPDPSSGDHRVETFDGRFSYLSGASDKLKNITDQGNTMNTGFSTVNQGINTGLQYNSSAYQQQQGLASNLLQTRSKYVSNLVNNERTN